MTEWRGRVMSSLSGHRLGQLRADVLAVHGSVCWLCGGDIDLSLKYPNPGAFVVDHVLPESRGGTHALTNCHPAHAVCNRAKGDRLPSELWAGDPVGERSTEW